MCDVSRGRVLTGWLDTVRSVRRGTIQQRVGVVELQQLQCRQRERECRGVEIVCGVCGGSVREHERVVGMWRVSGGHVVVGRVVSVQCGGRWSVQQCVGVRTVRGVCGRPVQRCVGRDSV